MLKINPKTAGITICTFHFFGALGFISPFAPWFIALTPLNLLLSAFLILNSYVFFEKINILKFIFIGLLGFFIEVIGVKTGLIFGNYFYGPVLGIHLLNVPILISINWLLVTISIANFVKWILNSNSKPKTKNQEISNKIIMILFGAILMTLLDYIIEPVAMKYGFWNWENNIIPFQNYFAWFLCSLVMLSIYFFKNQPIKNEVSFYFLASQIFFFGLLNILS